jgi:hypothetical protein
MAFGMTSNARKSPMSGLYAPVEGFDEAGRRQPERPSDRADLHGLQRRNPLKDICLPAGLLLVSPQIHSDHFSQIDES